MDIILELDENIELNGSERIEHMGNNKVILHTKDKKYIFTIEKSLFSYIAVYEDNKRFLIKQVGKME